MTSDAVPFPALSVVPRLLLLCAAMVACSGKDADSGAGGDSAWLMPRQDLGADRVASTDADLSDPSGLWFAAAHFLPGLDWDDPVVDVPLFVFESIAMDGGVADSGSCPYEQLDGGQTTWRSDCRSTNGYEWTGRMVRTRWSEGGIDYTRWDSDLDIVGDTDDPEFTHLSIQGAMVYASGDDSTLATGIQGNVAVSLSGYWSRADADDPREQAWRDWAWTGRDELTTDGAHHIEGHGRLGGVGSLGFTTDRLTVSDACDASPTGTVEVDGTEALSLEFRGATDCRRCATLTGSDAATEVCAR